MKIKEPKLFLSMILGDFEDISVVKRALDSIKNNIDGMYVTITYKESQPKIKHKLVKLLNKYKADISFFKWTNSFSEARQFSLDQIPKGDNIFVIWMDADDIIDKPELLSNIVLEMYNKKFSATYFDYWYQVDIDKKTGRIREVVVKHKRERIILNDGNWKWVGELHETLIEQRQENAPKYVNDDIKIIHLSNSERMDANIDRNIFILEESLKKQNRRDPRTLIYLAKAYFDKARMLIGEQSGINYLDLALNLFYEYLEGSGEVGKENYREGSGWAEERSTAYGYIAEIAILSKRPDMAIQAYQSAIDEAPWFPNYYIDMAMAYLTIGDYKKAKHWLSVATSVPEPSTTIIVTPRDLKTRALEVSFQINLHEGKIKESIEDLDALIKIMPEDELLKSRLATTIQLQEFNQACQSAVYLGKYLEKIGESDKAQYLVKSFSDEMQKEKFASEMRHRFLPEKKWGDDEVAILCGPGFEEWSPKSVETGLGGSEEAVVYLSQELNKLGWKVTVYANPGKEAGDYDGVLYEPWYNLNPKDSFNALILWRNIGFVDLNPKTKFTMVWLHDVPSCADFTEERVAKVDKIAVLSEYHKSILKMEKGGEFIDIPEDKVFLTSNGLPDNITEHAKGIKRKDNKLIYMSSPDRGLVYLLNNWDKIKSEIPDAELDVYYGFQIYDAIHAGNPARMKWKEQIMKLMEQPGITYKGRVGHEELHKAIAGSSIWAYPTNFTEISCISGMKSQILGTIPVTITLAALDETVKNGIKIDADINLPEVQEEYVEALIKLMKDKKEQEDIRNKMIPWAREYFSWKNVASTWDVTMRLNTQSIEKRMLIKEKNASI